MADSDLAYLTSLSEHPNRPGDVSNMNPDFASRLAAALRQANAAGLKLGVMSGYRDDTTTGSAYDAGGNSSHGYGLASDISGLDGPNGKITQQWAQIASANGLHNPYGVDNKAEFNHWQLPPQPLEQTPKLLAALKDARATGDWNNVWSAYNSGGGPSRVASATPISGGNSHADFILNYAKQIGVDPNLALGIANAEGLRSWSSSNPNAASTVDVENGKPFSFGDFQLNVRNGMGNQALAAGIDPRDPTQWQAADRFALDQMKAGGVGPWKGDPVAAAYLKSGQAPGPIDPSIIARGGYSPPIPGAAAPTPGTTLAGIAPDQSKALMGDLSQLDKSLGGKGLGGAGGTGGDEPQPAPMGPAPPIRNMSNPAAFSAALWGNTLNSMQTPEQWGAQPPGQNPYSNVGGAPIGQQFGTQLGSMQQLQQMMAMMGNPYGDAGYG